MISLDIYPQRPPASLGLAGVSAPAGTPGTPKIPQNSKLALGPLACPLANQFPRQPPTYQQAISVALAGTPATTRRVYARHLAAWLDWSGARGLALSRANVLQWLDQLRAEGKGPSSIVQASSALKRLALEAAALGYLPPEAAQRIQSIRVAPAKGHRAGTWLTKSEARKLLDTTFHPGLGSFRDRAIIAILLGCGLRRAELCGLTKQHFITRDGITLIQNLVGKGGRVRTVVVPGWALKPHNEYVSRVPYIKDDAPLYDVCPSTVRDIVQRYGALIGVKLNPHDLRRTHAKLSRLAGAPLETIQHTLGHASVKTTEIYCRTGEEANSGQYIDLELSDK